ncbi:hypothetical protein N7490_006283 [Penicillium lividum]|nr:hypothetical protein N7490_006283 [Penicillium lividum]
MERDKRATRFNMCQAQAPFPLQVKFPEKTAAQHDGTESSLKRQEIPAAGPSRSRKILKSPSGSIIESEGLGPAVYNGSPWDTYKLIFTCDLAGKVSISEHRRQDSQLVAFRTSKRTEGKELLTKYAQLRHINIISATECFKEESLFHFAVEDLPLSLEHLVASDAYPTEVQLASILKQVSFHTSITLITMIFMQVKIMDGLCYLIDCGYQHPCLKCSTALISLDGVVKIGMTLSLQYDPMAKLTAKVANLELTVPFTPEHSQSPSVKRLGFLAMELMQKYAKENVGIDDTRRWPIDSKAFDFLLSTTSARSVSELSQHPLIEKSSSPGTLAGLVRLAMVSACTFYSYME